MRYLQLYSGKNSGARASEPPDFGVTFLERKSFPNSTRCLTSSGATGATTIPMSRISASTAPIGSPIPILRSFSPQLWGQAIGDLAWRFIHHRHARGQSTPRIANWCEYSLLLAAPPSLVKKSEEVVERSDDGKNILRLHIFHL